MAGRMLTLKRDQARFVCFIVQQNRTLLPTVRPQTLILVCVEYSELSWHWVPGLWHLTWLVSIQTPSHGGDNIYILTVALTYIQPASSWHVHLIVSHSQASSRYIPTWNSNNPYCLFIYLSEKCKSLLNNPWYKILDAAQCNVECAWQKYLTGLYY